MPRTSLYKYTPGQASPEELEATFVARQGLLNQLLTRTQQWCSGEAPEHTLILAPRGMGKTHLLRLFAHRLTGLTLASPLSVALFPEESYRIGSVDDLLLEIWRRSGEGDREQPPEPAVPGAAWVLDQMRTGHRDHGNRYLVLLDGFDLLLDQLRESDERELHRVLTTERHVCVIATAAVQAPLAIFNHNRPLFQGFRMERLRPLEAAQADELLRLRADWAGDTELLARWPELAPKIRAVADLTGGNPRLLLMLYQSLELGELPSVVEAFRALLDELTPFYKHVVESRAPQQRKLLVLAAFHDRGPSPSQLASESGLPERQVSALLGPLVKDGLLRRVRRPGSRTSAYPFAEPLLRMWLQMRASPEGERRVACIVEFFRAWYENNETDYLNAFTGERQRISELHLAGNAEGVREAILAFEYLAQAAASLAASNEAFWRLVESGPLHDADAEARGSLQQALLASAERGVTLAPDDTHARHNRALALLIMGRVDDALKDLTVAGGLDKYPWSRAWWLVALLSTLGDHQEAVRVLVELVEPLVGDEVFRPFGVLLGVRVAVEAQGRVDSTVVEGAWQAVGSLIEAGQGRFETGALIQMLSWIRSAYDDESCQEVIERLETMLDDATPLELFRTVLAHLAGGRDPYFIEALNPDVRRAVEVMLDFVDSLQPLFSAPLTARRTSS